MMMRPFSNELQELRSRMNQAFDGDNEPNAPRLWAPAVDVAETDAEIVLHAELPGMKKDDIDIQLNGDTLVLRGERKQEAVARGEHFHRIERQYGAWQRTFQIEVPIEIANVAASFEDGVLTVTLPKQQAVQPRQIAIEVK